VQCPLIQAHVSPSPLAGFVVPSLSLGWSETYKLEFGVNVNVADELAGKINSMEHFKSQKLWKIFGSIKIDRWVVPQLFRPPTWTLELLWLDSISVSPPFFIHQNYLVWHV